MSGARPAGWQGEHGETTITSEGPYKQEGQAPHVFQLRGKPQRNGVPPDLQGRGEEDHANPPHNVGSRARGEAGEQATAAADNARIGPHTAIHQRDQR